MNRLSKRHEKNFKSVTTYVPDWVNWWTKDSSGYIYGHEKKPHAKFVSFTEGLWVSEGRCISMGQGPKSDFWEEDFYKLKYV